MGWDRDLDTRATSFPGQGLITSHQGDTRQGTPADRPKNQIVVVRPVYEEGVGCFLVRFWSCVPERNQQVSDLFYYVQVILNHADVLLLALSIN